MAFVSELTGRPVTDIDGTRIGVLKDLIARTRKEFHHPVIDAIIVEGERGSLTVPFTDLAALLSTAIPLKHPAVEIKPFQSQEGDIKLVDDVLDKQIIDINGARVVRVNDIEVVRVNGNVVVSNVDIGVLGILRRIGLERAGRWLARRFKADLSLGSISWEFVEPLLHDKFMRLKVPVEKLRELHPSDLAEIISDLNRAETSQLLEQLDIEHLADTLEEIEPDLQAELSPERTEELLGLMEDDEADEVRRLLLYAEDTAGGLMTTEFVTVKSNLSAEQAIQSLRSVGEEAELIYYVYVTDDDCHLVGVFSLSALILAQPDTPVTEFMHSRFVSVNLKTEQDEIAQVVAKYNLMAVPVVDDQDCIHGIVTADDALDKIIPTAWKKRLPHFFGALQ